MSSVVEWQADGMLSAGGKSLEYHCHGPSPTDAPTIVLLHEGLGSAALWRDFPDRLSSATGMGVMAYSRAGYGQSDAVDLPRPLDYMSRHAAYILPEVLDAIGFETGMLLGHSDGATISAIYAGSVSDPRVAGLALVAPHFFTEEMGLTEIAQARQAFETGDLRNRMAKYHRDPENAFRGWNEAWLHPDFKAWDVTDVLDHIRVPVLAIQGRDDQYGTLAQIDVLADRCLAPVEKLILDGSKHAPYLDQTDAVLEAVSDFSARLDLARGQRPEAR